MSDAAKHASSASANIQEVVNIARAGDGIGISDMLALTHSQLMLALFEEQRTANLIAWSTANGTEPTPALTTEINARLGQ
ncbi:hypothetical protein SEA_GRASSBOY_68 [Microbacterium phage Grassboy]|nr:hypothetical protein SEA_GRASSBOY_68 [Microbacterium phage Grassboy]